MKLMISSDPPLFPVYSLRNFWMAPRLLIQYFETFRFFPMESNVTSKLTRPSHNSLIWQIHTAMRSLSLINLLVIVVSIGHGITASEVIVL